MADKEPAQAPNSFSINVYTHASVSRCCKHHGDYRVERITQNADLSTFDLIMPLKFNYGQLEFSA